MLFHLKETFALIEGVTNKGTKVYHYGTSTTSKNVTSTVYGVYDP